MVQNVTPVTDDPVAQLHQAMKSLAMGKNDSQRRKVYELMMTADLSIALQPGVEPEEALDDPSKWLITEYLQGMPVFVVFTCADAVEVFSEGAPSTLDLRGFKLFPKLVSVKPASLLINPGFRFGGELYLNELRMLANAAPRYKAMKF